ncbi:MAG: hypothetical protein GX575_07710 [Candidatus Anammoximicrobium sp.]|nr:hypothetical protein [Candidatus Anammoximicrobium sp.]
MMIRCLGLFGLLTGIAVAGTGCGASDGRVEVSGEVAFDGQPVQAGMVSFEPSGGGAPPQSATIENGKYQAVLEPGQYLVRITAADLAKMGPPSDDIHAPAPAFVPLLPPPWNEQSQLTVEIKPGATTHHFRGAKGQAPKVESDA